MTDVLFVAVSAVALVGALTVVFTREVVRLALGLGAFLLAVAAYFAFYGFGFLALAQLFIYVGGVLVLVLFAIMLVHRAQPGAPSLTSRHDVLAAVASVGVGAFAFVMLRPLAAAVVTSPAGTVDDLGAMLLGPMLPQFELAGLLLLAALVAVVSIGGGERS